MNSRVIAAISIAFACAQSTAAQTLTARQLFYKDDAEAKPVPKPAPKAAPKKSPPKAAPKPTTPAPASSEVPTAKQESIGVHSAAYTAERPLGLRYALVKVVDGAESEVSPTATFHSGDMVRVKVEGNRDGYLYVISRGSSGNWKPLFPAADINGGDNKVVMHKAYRLPSATQAFTFDEQAGQEQLFIVYSPEPVKDIESLIPSLGTPAKGDREMKRPEILSASAAPINDAFVSRLRNTYSRDLMVQTVAPGQPAPATALEPTLPENAVYIVNKSGGQLVADIRLEHK